MYFFKVPFITFLSVTLVASQNFAAVNNDIALISNDLGVLEDAVADFDGSEPLAISVGQAAGTLEYHLVQAKTDTDASGLFSASESSNLASAAVALVPGHVTGLGALVAKQPDFAAGGYSPNVHDQLVSLSVANDNFWDALEAKVVPTYTASIASAASTVAAAYASAITAFA